MLHFDSLQILADLYLLLAKVIQRSVTSYLFSSCIKTIHETLSRMVLVVKHSICKTECKIKVYDGLLISQNSMVSQNQVG